MYRMTNGRLEVKNFFIQEIHTIASSNNTPDAYFTQLRFEAPQASVIYLYISCQPTDACWCPVVDNVFLNSLLFPV